jgi:hypothetical protein
VPNEKYTLIIATYGAILATTVFLFDIIKYFKDKAKLFVKTAPFILIESNEPYKEKRKIRIDVINISKKPITVTASGFKLKTDSLKDTMQIIDIELPKKINEGESHTSYTDIDNLPLDKIFYAWVSDTTGKSYKSKKWPLRGFERIT